MIRPVNKSKGEAGMMSLGEKEEIWSEGKGRMEEISGVYRERSIKGKRKLEVR